MSNKGIQTAGFALIDALIGLTLVGILCTAFITSIYHASVTSGIARDRLSASIASLEVYEVGVHLANEDFTELLDNLATCASGCHFRNDGTSWTVHNGSETVNDGRFERFFTLARVSRDSTSDDIVTSGGVIDSDTLELTVTVNWTTRGEAYTDSVSTYLHRM